jgi:hypothetical protein
MTPQHSEPPFREINDSIVQASQTPSAAISHRRRVPRQSTSWFGRYRVGEAVEWGDCEVVDVSVIGIGAFVTTPPAATDLLGHRIAIEVRAAAGGSVSLQLTGEIRHVQPMPDGRLRIGAEFSGLSETERAILDALEHMGIAW